MIEGGEDLTLSISYNLPVITDATLDLPKLRAQQTSRMQATKYDFAEIEAVAVDRFDESTPTAQAAAVVDLQADESLTQTQQTDAASGRWSGVWRALTNAWDIADEQLATLFGLNESKYEWAVREYYWQKRQEEEHSNQATQTTGLAVQHIGTDDQITDARSAATQSEALQGSAMV